MGTLWSEIKEVEREVFGENSWAVFVDDGRQMTTASHQPDTRHDTEPPARVYGQEEQGFQSPAVRPGQGEYVMPSRLKTSATRGGSGTFELPRRPSFGSGHHGATCGCGSRILVSRWFRDFGMVRSANSHRDVKAEDYGTGGSLYGIKSVRETRQRPESKD